MTPHERARNTDPRTPRSGSSRCRALDSSVFRPSPKAPGSFFRLLRMTAESTPRCVRSYRHHGTGVPELAIVQGWKTRARFGLAAEIDVCCDHSGSLCQARQHLAPIIHDE